MPTVKEAVVMTVPTIPRVGRVSRLASSVRTPAMSVISARTSARPARKLVGGDVAAVLEAVVDRLGDDLGLVAGAA